MRWPWQKAPLADVRGAPLDDPMVHYVHQATRMPDPGAGNYAFETLQLAVHSPIDRAVRVRYAGGGSSIGQAIPRGSEQRYVGAAVPVDGIPSMAGGIYGARQFTPDGDMASLGSVSGANAMSLRWNNPASALTSPGAAEFGNAPFPLNGKQAL